ncbi:DUF1996 domain-containing protein [Streptomyces sp. NPDC047072]|uniref:DUF1996 domain-containing protein n=1 Tax=Streptomyces sp. NPDC047072 TaxID=3154809 RepID=UPI0033DC8A05
MRTRFLRPGPRLTSVFLPVTLGLALLVALGVVGVARTAPASQERTGGRPASSEYVRIGTVSAAPAPVTGPAASVGTYTQECGRNTERHRNADNVVFLPGVTGGAHHTHDYVGNLSTNARSTNASLAAARTTCENGDRSAYYWPVVRRLDRTGTDAHTTGGGRDGNTGEIVTAASVRVEFLGNPASPVVAMPRFLRLVTGDPVAHLNQVPNIHAQWGCSGYAERFTTKYTLCPAGSGVTRTFDFPSCWDGLNTDSADHRGHAVFPGADGSCPQNTFAVPRLRVTVTYRLPAGTPYALDSFPEQMRDPKTDHALFLDVMTERQMARVVDCLNGGRHCTAD